MSKEVYAFQQGYICALACIAKGHGESTELEEALRALGPVDWNRIEAYDKEALQETIKRVKRKQRQVKP